MDVPLAFALRRVSVSLPSDGSTGGAQVAYLMPKLPPSVRSLRLWAYGQHIAGLDDLVTDSLVELDVRGVRPHLNAGRHENLQRLTMMAITPDTLESLVSSDFPNLVSLDVALEPLHPLYGTSALANGNFPALKELRVLHGLFPAPLVDLINELAQGSLLPQLNKLAMGIVTSPTAQRIAHHAPAFAHLERLELHGEVSREIMSQIGAHAVLVRRLS